MRAMIGVQIVKSGFVSKKDPAMTGDEGRVNV